MTKRVYIICHPGSGQFKGQKILKEVEKILDRFQLITFTYITQYPAHAKALTQQIISRWSSPTQHYLLVVGGDGTLHEVVEQLIAMNFKVPLSYIPSGSGNDFARSWLPNLTPVQIIEKMLYQHQPQSIPIFTYKDTIKHDQGIVLNSIGFGLDAKVNAYAQEIRNQNKWGFLSQGSWSYRLAAVLAVLKLPRFDVMIETPNEKKIIHDCHLISISNTPYIGGGLVLNPTVNAKDHSIGTVAYYNVALKQLLPLAWQVLRQKLAQQSPNYELFQTNDWIKITIEENQLGQVDGEELESLPVELTIQLDIYPFYF